MEIIKMDRKCVTIVKLTINLTTASQATSL
jgi:hypothetical protein